MTIFSIRCVLQKRVGQGAPAIAFTSTVDEPMKAWEKQNLPVQQTTDIRSRYTELAQGLKPASAG